MNFSATPSLASTLLSIVERHPRPEDPHLQSLCQVLDRWSKGKDQNHCEAVWRVLVEHIDQRMAMDFETYVAKLFRLLRPNGWLFFESHNVFGPGTGGPGDDGDLDRKFDIMERYFEPVDACMHRSFVPAHDIDKLFVRLRRRATYTPDIQRSFSLAQARTHYAN